MAAGHIRMPTKKYVISFLICPLFVNYLEQSIYRKTYNATYIYKNKAIWWQIFTSQGVYAEGTNNSISDANIHLT